MDKKPSASPEPCKNFYEANLKWQATDDGASSNKSIPVLAGTTVSRAKGVSFLNTVRVRAEDGRTHDVSLNTAEDNSKMDPLESRRMEGLQLSFSYLRQAANKASVTPEMFEQCVISSVITRLLKERDVGFYHTLLEQDEDGLEPLAAPQKQLIAETLDQRSRMLAAAQQQRMDDRRKSTEERLQNLWLKTDLGSQTSSDSSYSLPATPNSMSPSSSFGGNSLKESLKSDLTNK